MAASGVEETAVASAYHHTHTHTHAGHNVSEGALSLQIPANGVQDGMEIPSDDHQS